MKPELGNECRQSSKHEAGSENTQKPTVNGLRNYIVEASADIFYRGVAGINTARKHANTALLMAAALAASGDRSLTGVPYIRSMPVMPGGIRKRLESGDGYIDGFVSEKHMTHNNEQVGGNV